MHVLFNAVPDIAFALLALAGLAYLLPEPVRKLENKRGVRLFLIAFFSFFGVFAIVVNAVNREAQDNKDDRRGEEIRNVRQSVHDIEQDLLHPKAGITSEANRREHISSALRAEYIISHDPIDPEILSGVKMPPEQWMNERLHQLGETWTLSPSVPTRIAAPVRSYLVFEAMPRFIGSTTPNVEGGDFIAGDPIAFNVHYKNTGPNPVVLIGGFFSVSLEPNIQLETQQTALSLALAKLDRGRKLLGGNAGSSFAPGAEFFNSATERTDSDQMRAWTQQDLDDLHAGTLIAFVIAELIYKDAGTEHHERMCYWLAPPGKPLPGIWHTCDVFRKSD